MNEHLIFTRINSGKSPDFGDVFSKSIDLFKKVWIQGFIHLLLNFVVLVPLIIALYALIAVTGLSIFGASALLDGVDNSSEISSVAGTTMSFFTGAMLTLVFILFSFLAYAVQFAIRAHFYKVCKQTDLGEPVSTDYFFYFKKGYLKKLTLLSVCYFLILAISSALCFLPVLYAIIPLQFFGVIFAFNPELEVKDIVKAGFVFGNKVWGISFGLLILSGLLAYIIGILACGIGLYFTISFMFIPVYYLYKEGIGFPDDTITDLSEPSTF
ncbi:hypothetical protein NBT05_02855 [Aquimarina sp. ERC-38]|uniref:hypothetical protein n=1 Tax=Aquimarina sp. ERC-38 TaxID=2949996 RepID=UPI0022472640|nr:hypothetical protein [Aquimarina sp. ERC-38]UZO81420.1 hypothetical protein NBT05_02855 [Aquimarina sp. ERC-38]